MSDVLGGIKYFKEIISAERRKLLGALGKPEANI